jgi:glycosyltransferase involved in cell wall biosynthesis
MKKGELWIMIDGALSTFIREEIIYHSKKYESIVLVSRKPLDIAGLEDYISEAIVIPHVKPGANAYFSVRVLRWFLSDLLSRKSGWKYLMRSRYNLNYLLRCAGAADSLEKHLNRRPSEYKVLFSYWFADWALSMAWLKEKGAIKAFYSRAHGRDLFEFREPRTGKLPYRKKLLEHVDRVLTVSNAGCIYLKKRYPKYATKIERHYLGTQDHGLGKFNRRDLATIVTCARVRNIKRIFLVPEILSHMKTPVRWVHIGDENLNSATDSTMPRYKEAKASLERMPHVQAVFTGPLNNEDIFNYYKEHTANLFLNLSSTEGLPFVLIEAISMGIPLMATNVGGCSEIVTEQTGELLNPEIDPMVVAEKIDQFLSSEKNTETFREGVRSFWAENFTAENNYAKFYQVCNKTA